MGSRPAVLAAIRRVLEDKGLPADLDDDGVPMGEEGLGLDSLDIATVVAVLEEELEIDPFEHGDVEIGTLGGFVELYEDGTGG
ncbi:MAG: acyl carrier protein [Acidimicrobiia bacterium]|nr:acyl carrier protein [Acidimicrobiia bacterium]